MQIKINEWLFLFLIAVFLIFQFILLKPAISAYFVILNFGKKGFITD